MTDTLAFPTRKASSQVRAVAIDGLREFAVVYTRSAEAKGGAEAVLDAYASALADLEP